MFTLLFFEGYEDEEENNDEKEEISEEKSTKDVEDDDDDNHDDHPRVSLRQDDINLHYDIKDEIGKYVHVCDFIYSKFI